MTYIILFLISIVIILCVLDIIKDKESLKKESIKYLILSSLVYFLLQTFFTYVSPSTVEIINFLKEEMLNLPNSEIFFIKGILIFLITFYISSIADYLVHRFMSHSRLFWWTHEYHHLTNRVSLYMPGIAFRPYAFIGTVITTVWATVIFLSLCSLFNYNNLNTLYLVFIAQTLILIIIHSSYLRDKKFFSKIMRSLYLVSPEDHLLHHSYNTGFINYGNISILWDILFKTYKKYSENETYLVGTVEGRDYVDSVTFGLFNLKKFLKK